MNKTLTPTVLPILRSQLRKIQFENTGYLPSRRSLPTLSRYEVSRRSGDVKKSEEDKDRWSTMLDQLPKGRLIRHEQLRFQGDSAIAFCIAARRALLWPLSVEGFPVTFPHLRATIRFGFAANDW